MEPKRLVLDANILIRGCFGGRVRSILANHAEQGDFFMAQAALSEADRFVSGLARRRGLDAVVCQEALQSLLIVVLVADDELLAHLREEARARIRDPRRLAKPGTVPSIGMRRLDGGPGLLRRRFRDLDLRHCCVLSPLLRASNQAVTTNHRCAPWFSEAIQADAMESQQRIALAIARLIDAHQGREAFYMAGDAPLAGDHPAHPSLDVCGDVYELGPAFGA